MSQTQRQQRLAERAAARIGPCTAGMRTKSFAAFAEATDLRIAAGALKLTGGPYLEFQGSGYANFYSRSYGAVIRVYDEADSMIRRCISRRFQRTVRLPNHSVDMDSGRGCPPGVYCQVEL